MWSIEQITTLRTHGRTFSVVLFDGKYCSIEDKYITDGKLNTPLYGPALHVGNTVAECVEHTRNACEVDELTAAGIDPLTAAVMVAGKVSREQAEKMLAPVRAQETN